mmetsp:Transcript_98276/g.143870  ORF Transcript_98276/g.143870 Transcript_98276/m.143870 type:complete len:92 (+) Transcript_98276:120-395(+)
MDSSLFLSGSPGPTPPCPLILLARGRWGGRKKNGGDGAWARGGARIFAASTTSNCRVCVCLPLTVGPRATRDTDFLSAWNLGLNGKLFGFC